MNPEKKIEWLDALRSGRYPQTRSMLVEMGPGAAPTGYCCLGVACDLAVKAGVINPPDAQGTFTWVDDEGLTHYESGLLPHPVQEWLGITSDNPVVFPESDLTLAEMNDDGATFTEIADAIEDRL
jgi:hypothetical protein